MPPGRDPNNGRWLPGSPEPPKPPRTPRARAEAEALFWQPPPSSASPRSAVEAGLAEVIEANPSTALEALTVDVARSIRSWLPAMTIDQLIRVLGHLTALHKREGQTNVGVIVQFVGPSPK